MASSGAAGSVFERHARLASVLLLLFSVVTTDCVFTRVHALLAPAPLPTPHPFRVQHPAYDHGLKPLAVVANETWGPWRSAYYIDSLGFRDASAREVPLRSESRRILVIGDSFTEGMGVAYEKSFVGLLAAALGARCEVLNAGVASYCPIIYDRKIRYLLDEVGLRFDACVVFIDIGDIQDEVMYKFDARGNVVPRHARRAQEGRANRVYRDPLARLAPVEDRLAQDTTLLFRLYDALHGRLLRDAARAAMWTTDPKLFAEFGREGLAAAAEHMQELQQALALRGIPLTIAVYPWPDQIRARDRASRQSRFWQAWAAERGVGFIDYFPAFVNDRAPQAVVDAYFIPGDIHWNEAGHRVISDALLARLR